MIKLLSLFSGIGAFEKALENIGEPFKVVRYCEIDKYASKAYSLIHNLDENMNLKDVCTIETEELPKDIDLVTYGFPCQDISISGKQKGFIDENGDLTRSGLFFEALRIIEETKPKIAIAENVKALVGKKFTAEFKIVLDSLNDAGYKNYWAVLNAKDYGIPQNRERVFIISIRDDIDHGYTFPEKYELKLRLKDLLEDSVDEKYFIKIPNDLILTNNRISWDRSGKGYYSQQDRAYFQDGICPSLSASNVSGDKSQIALCDNPNKNIKPVFDDSPSIQRIDVPQTVRVRKYEVDKEKLVETLRKQKALCGWTNKELAEELEVPLTQVEHWFRTDKHFSIPDAEIWSNLKWLLEMDDINEFDEAIITFENREGTYEKAERCYHENGISPTITVAMADEKIINNLRIRKLTPKECFRLMGFDDKDCDILVKNKISNTQIYKMAGNSIVVDVLEEIFVELLNQYDDVFPMGGV